MGKHPNMNEPAFDSPLAWGAVRNQWGPFNEVFANWMSELGSNAPAYWQSLLISGATYPDINDPSEWPNAPSYKTGTDYVPYDQLAFLHKGEAVTPAGQSTGTTVNVTITGPIYGLNDLDKKIASSIKRTMRRGGLGFAMA